MKICTFFSSKYHRGISRKLHSKVHNFVLGNKIYLKLYANQKLLPSQRNSLAIFYFQKLILSKYFFTTANENSQAFRWPRVGCFCFRANGGRSLGPPAPPRPPARIFRKHPRQKANFSDFFCRRFPLG